jgi:hypothetical protein
MGIRSLKKAYEEEVSKNDISFLTKKSLRWFFEHTKKHTSNVNWSHAKAQGREGRPIPGRFFVYQYDPKFKDKLPYYDTLPLVLITSVTAKGWYGINFHYMPPQARMVIMEAMLKTLNNPTWSDDYKLRINWKKAVAIASKVGKHAFLKHSIKQYLASHLKTPLIELYPENWEMCLFLPMSKFKKSTASRVWANV